MSPLHRSEGPYRVAANSHFCMADEYFDICMQMNHQTNIPRPKGPAASVLRKRKYELVRAYRIPDNLLGGSLAQTYRRCGKGNCHCTKGRGHSMWSLTLSQRGTRRVEYLPRQWVTELEHVVGNTQAYISAIKELQAINLALLAIAQSEYQSAKRRRRDRKNGKSGK